jgi:hypothetical protein
MLWKDHRLMAVSKGAHVNNPAPPAPAAAAATVPPSRPVHQTRLACDSDQLDALIATPFVRTYSDLITDPAQLNQLVARFPDSHVELIDRGLGDRSGLASIADIETGALKIGQVRDWLGAKHAAGHQDLVVYCDRDNLDAVVQACDGMGYWHWIAAPGQLVVPSHPDAQVQFAFASGLGAHVDLTIIPNFRYRPWLIPVGPRGTALGRALDAAAAASGLPVIAPDPAAAAAAPSPELAAGVAALLGAHADAPADAHAVAVEHSPAPMSWHLASLFHAGVIQRDAERLAQSLGGLRSIIRSGLPAETLRDLSELI